MAKIQSARVSGVARVSGFPLFSEVILLFFWFSRYTGGTYDNQTWTKIKKKICMFI